RDPGCERLEPEWARAVGCGVERGIARLDNDQVAAQAEPVVEVGHRLGQGEDDGAPVDRFDSPSRKTKATSHRRGDSGAGEEGSLERVDDVVRTERGPVVELDVGPKANSPHRAVPVGLDRLGEDELNRVCAEGARGQGFVYD